MYKIVSVNCNPDYIVTVKYIPNSFFKFFGHDSFIINCYSAHGFRWYDMSDSSIIDANSTLGLILQSVLDDSINAGVKVRIDRLNGK